MDDHSDRMFAAADLGRRALDMTPAEIFVVYASIGGLVTVAAMERFFAHEGELPDREYDKLAAALNDEFLGQSGDHPVPTSRRLDDPSAITDLAATLARLPGRGPS